MDTGEVGIARASPRLQARIAGFLYLLITSGALFVPFTVAPSGMALGDQATTTAARIAASASSYAFSGAAQAGILACDIGVAALLYQLLRPVGQTLALLAALFRVVFAAIAGANLVNHFAPLLLLTGAGNAALQADQLQALALLFLRLRTAGFDIALVFFGFHCVILGYLLFKSGFFPRFLGLLIAIGGLGYLANIFVYALPIAMRGHLFPYVMLPAGLAEILLTLWLIIVGVNAARWKQVAASAFRLNADEYGR